jgi:two-component system response regulator LytT
MKIHCVIADDEYLAIRVLEQYARAIDDLEIMQTFTDPREAVTYLKTHATDLLILDIQMPYLSGFDVIQTLQPKPVVIFVTARHDFAVQAYDMEVLDYLVKPVSAERFQKAIEKAKEYLDYRNDRTSLQDLAKNFLMIKSEYRIVKIYFESILYVEGLNEYVKIHTPEKTYTTLAALKDIESELPATAFMRIHKSFITSLASIKDFNSRSVRLENEKELPVGRTYKTAFLEKMKQ